MKADFIPVQNGQFQLDLEIAGTTASVTGASRVTGRAIALALAREGCHLIPLADARWMMGDD